jgi:hypothetical protein
MGESIEQWSPEIKHRVLFDVRINDIYLLSFSYVPLDVSGNTRLLLFYIHYITNDKCLSYTAYSVSEG